MPNKKLFGPVAPDELIKNTGVIFILTFLIYDITWKLGNQFLKNLIIYA